MKIFKYATSVGAILFMLSGAVFADGFIVVPDRRVSPDPFPLEVKYHRVNVTINEKTALTEIDQEFYNPTDRNLEGQYMFPIPKGAVIEKFSMYINGVDTPAEMLDSVRARQIYEDIVRQMIDPALMEYSDQGVLKVRIFPIEPRSTKRVKISYREIIQSDGNLYSYTYPLNTEKFSSKPLKDVSVSVNIRNSKAIKNIFSPTHNIDVARKNSSSAMLSYEENNVKPDTDFKIFYAVQQSPMGISNFTQAGEKNEDGFFMMDIDPGNEYDNIRVSEKDVTFVLDVSGSMRGENMEQAKKALTYCVDNLNNGDRFQIISFSTEADTLFNKLTEKNSESLNDAGKFIQNLKAVGGTNMEDAFKKINTADLRNDRPHVIIFITDGKPTIGITEDDALLRIIGSSSGKNLKIFTFGIGYDINTHLLDRITEMSGTFRSYISPKENIDKEIAAFFDKVSSPVMTDVEIKVTGGVRLNKMYPGKIPDLYKGSSVSVLGRFRNFSDSEIILSGKINGVKKEFRFNGNFKKSNNENTFIAPLWALRRTAFLLDNIRLHGENRELVEEITLLAKQYGIITPYTSYLILEDERALVRNNVIHNEDQLMLKAVPDYESMPAEAVKKEHKQMFDTTGEGSVRSSSEIQKMNQTFNSSQKDNFKYINESDRNSGSAKLQMKTAAGRSFYFNGTSWIDSDIQKSGYKKTVKVKFAGKEYFRLINDGLIDRQAASLGRNVSFVKNGVLYEISE
ncbi:MAG: VWA domain-containing protein [Spirochaetes bacterium]|nr:VWA domain-containing protein [Spirochaetota bacterium]